MRAVADTVTQFSKSGVGTGAAEEAAAPDQAAHQSALDNANASLAKAEACRAKAEARMDEAEARKAEAKARMDEAEARMAEADARMAQAIGYEDQTKALRAEAEARRAEAEARMDEAEAKTVKAETYEAETKARRAEAEDRIAEAEARMAEAEARMAEAEARMAQAIEYEARANTAPAKSPVRVADLDARKVPFAQRELEADPVATMAEEEGAYAAPSLPPPAALEIPHAPDPGTFPTMVPSCPPTLSPTTDLPAGEVSTPPEQAVLLVDNSSHSTATKVPASAQAPALATAGGMAPFPVATAKDVMPTGPRPAPKAGKRRLVSKATVIS